MGAPEGNVVRMNRGEDGGGFLDRPRAPSLAGGGDTAPSELGPGGPVEENQVRTGIGQLTPVPPSPQYPAGFFARYCWW
ncbi:hypothetical protein BH09MYX1_BH09MYX1_51300 [soil metagenome]